MEREFTSRPFLGYKEEWVYGEKRQVPQYGDPVTATRIVQVTHYTYYPKPKQEGTMVTGYLEFLILGCIRRIKLV